MILSFGIQITLLLFFVKCFWKDRAVISFVNVSYHSYFVSIFMLQMDVWEEIWYWKNKCASPSLQEILVILTWLTDLSHWNKQHRHLSHQNIFFVVLLNDQRVEILAVPRFMWFEIFWSLKVTWVPKKYPVCGALWYFHDLISTPLPKIQRFCNC